MIVKAYKINKYHIFYKCPFCLKSHKHGSGNNFKNRNEYRSSHCLKIKGDLTIIIDENTDKILD